MSSPMSVTTPYESLTNMKLLLGLGQDQEERLTALLLSSTEAIDEYCHRTFAVGTSGVTRRFDSPLSSLLWIDDCQAVTSVQVGSTTLTTSQYEARPLNLTLQEPFYNQIVRLSGAGGVPMAWSTSRALVSVTGTWGYMTSVPARVVEVCRIMTARLWQREIARYANLMGTTQSGFTIQQAPKCSLDADCKELLTPLVRKWHYANTPAVS